ncbi:hypothetical protein [Methylobacterium trifolii]|uniref:Uncharacterized protein n=1 Tax=Methylobacterium trifolii TaxID=1003092 RepID=A0ABQ4U1Y3_9HYPH|nr:hypothetical protein [Methylobacterium trifolii]GJE59855.1 hypothetical protein MPOCJGCO_1957 [Methylobacterium trifolii]
MLLLSALWPGLAGAVLLGIGIGWLSGMPRDRASLPGLAAAWLLLAGLALAGPVQGTAGLWIESAAMLLAAYLAGCGLGALAARLAARPAPKSP